MYRLIRECSLPKFIKVLLYILLTLTCIYWIGYFTYKILECIRVCINGITKEKGRWWFFLLCLLMILVALCIAFRYNPFLEFWNYLKSWFLDLKDNFLEILK